MWCGGGGKHPLSIQAVSRDVSWPGTSCFLSSPATELEDGSDADCGERWLGWCKLSQVVLFMIANVGAYTPCGVMVFMYIKPRRVRQESIWMSLC